MSDFKRWTDEQSDATAAEREVLAAGSTKGLALGEHRKAELRRALAIAISLPLPPDGGSNDGQGGGPPPPPPAPPPPVTPPPIAETAGALGGIGKLIFSGKASGALVAFVLAAGATAGVLGAATLTEDRQPAPTVFASVTPIVKHPDDGTGPAPATVTAPSTASAAPVTASATRADLPAPSGARPARSVGEKAANEPDPPNAPPLAPTDSPAPTPAPSAAPTVPSSPALVVPSAPDIRLADEIARVRSARDALRSGNAALTLSLLDALDREHPAGTLGQEREAMRIEALANTGRTGEARSRADAFLARHPGSAFASSVGRYATR